MTVYVKTDQHAFDELPKGEAFKVVDGVLTVTDNLGKTVAVYSRWSSAKVLDEIKSEEKESKLYVG